MTLDNYSFVILFLTCLGISLTWANIRVTSIEQLSLAEFSGE